MGMAAGQARLLSITSRMADNELRAQIINNNKMRLATQSSQASEAYVTALNEAQMMFTNYDANNNASYQKLTYNALTAYSPYNNQYILTNASGNVLLSEKDAQNYINADGDVTEFLKSYGLKQGTTYFNELANYYTTITDENGATRTGIAYKTGGYNDDGKEVVGIINVPGKSDAGADAIATYIQELYEGIDESVHVGYMNAVSSEEYNTYNELLDNYYTAQEAWLETAIEVMQKFIFENKEIKSQDFGGNNDNTIAKHLEDYLLKDLNTEGKVNDNGNASDNSNHIDHYIWNLQKTLDVLNKYAYKDVDSDGNILDTTNNSYFSYLKEVLDENAGVYKKTFACGGSNLSDDNADYKLNKEINGNEVIFKFQKLVEKVDENGDLIVDENGDQMYEYKEFLAIKGTQTTEQATNADGELIYDENGDPVYNLDFAVYGLNLAENVQYDPENRNWTTLDKAEDNKFKIDDNNYIDFSSISDRNDDWITNYFYGDVNYLPENWSLSIEKKQTVDERKEAIKEVIEQLTSNNYSNVFANWDPENSNFNTTGNSEFTSTKDAATELIKWIFGDDADYETYKGYIGNIQDCYNKLKEDGDSENLKKFEKIHDVYLLDCIMNTYGEPKYAWTDESDLNGNADIKAKWYENLFKRIQNGGYKVLQDGLASSSEWIQFALESGIALMEQLDNKQNWNSLIYSNCSDITEQTNDAAIAKAEAEYKSAMNKIEAKDKRYDMELKNIDTEHNSLQTEYDSIKTAIDKNIERTFKLYS